MGAREDLKKIIVEQKTDKVIEKLKSITEPKAPLMGKGDGFFVPNYSGVKSEALKTSDVDITGAGGHVIKDEAGADLTARRNLNFTGAGVAATDNAGTDSTDVTIPFPTIDEVLNPTTSKTFNFGNNKSLTFTSVDNTPVAGEGTFNFEATGAYTGDLVHMHQHNGNPGATDLLHIEAEDADVVPLRIIGIGTYDMIAGDISVGNIVTSGTVDGIDIATDVAANTLKVTNVTTNITVTEAPTNVSINSSDGTDDTIAAADETNAGVMTTTMYDEHVLAVAHYGDNTQAHSDYLLNSGTDIAVGPLTITADNSTADQAYVPMVLYNTDATPPAASGFPIGTLYVQYTA